MTKAKNNNCLSPTMDVLSRRGLNCVPNNVADKAFINKKEERGALTATVNSRIEILWDLALPSITDPTKEGFWNNPPSIFWVFQILTVIYTIPAITIKAVMVNSEIWYT